MAPPTMQPFMAFEPFNAVQALMDAETLKGARTGNAAAAFALQQAQDPASAENRLRTAQASGAEAGLQQKELELAVPRLSAAAAALDSVQATLDSKGAEAAKQRLAERMSMLQSQGILPKDFSLGVDLQGMSEEDFAAELRGARDQIGATLRALSPPGGGTFTLKPGDVRYENGVPVAANPENPAYGTQQVREGADYVTYQTENGVPVKEIARSPIKESVPPATTVTVNGEKIPPGLVDAATKYSDQADTQLNQVNELVQFREMAKDAETGLLTPITLPIKAAFQSIGVTLDDQLPLLQAMQAQQNQMALKLRNPQSGFGLTGNTSNQDVIFLKQSVAGIEKTPEANRAILTILMAKQRREGNLNALKSDYIWQNGTLKGWDAVRQNYINSHAFFTPEETDWINSLRVRADNTPRVTSQADYDALESGTEFIGSDGKRYRKP